MNSLTAQERAAMDAVARRFSAAWKEGSGASDVYLTVGAQRIAVHLATLKRRGARDGGAARLRLRFDKVAIDLMTRLQAALRDAIPQDVTVALTVTAPIRLGSKTAVAVEEKVRALLERGSTGRGDRQTIHGNCVHIQLLRDESRRAPRMIGFVHNVESEAPLLLDMTAELLELVNVDGNGRAARRAGDRWLVAISAGGAPYVDVYRYIFSALRAAAGVAKILMVCGEQRVEDLTSQPRASSARAERAG